MIKCNPYNATFQTDRTCVSNQHELAEMKKFVRKKCRGNAEIHLTAMPPKYYRIHKCDGCKTGAKLYAKAKKEGRLPVSHIKKVQKVDAGKMAAASYHLQRAVSA